MLPPPPITHPKTLQAPAPPVTRCCREPENIKRLAPPSAGLLKGGLVVKGEDIGTESKSKSAATRELEEESEAEAIKRRVGEV